MQSGFRFERAQSSVEFAVMFAVVVAALLGMLVYMKRGLSGGYRQSADQIGGQYAPRQAVSDITMTEISNTTSVSELTNTSGEPTMVSTTTIKDSDPQTTRREGFESIGPLGTNIWER